jgi:UDP:flavonoid glycosyltransferase YjiC (YdhE family)
VDLLGTASIDPCPPSLQYPATVAPTRRIHTRYIPYNGIAEVPATLPHTDTDRTRICLTWGTSVARLLGDHAFLPGQLLLAASKLAEEHNADLILAITKNQTHLLPDLPPHVHLHENIPLHALLPTCHAVIHQGGAGTLLTSLLNGLPQIILTQLVDQTANAIQLAATGAAINLSATTLTTTELLDAGHELLDNPTYQQAAQTLQHEITAQPTPTQIVPVLEGLAAGG